MATLEYRELGAGGEAEAWPAVAGNFHGLISPTLDFPVGLSPGLQRGKVGSDGCGPGSKAGPDYKQINEMR